MIAISQISSSQASSLCRRITADLPDYFGLPEVNQHYAIGVKERTNFAAIVDGEAVGLISIDFPYPNNSNIYWMGVLKNHHSKGIGKKLLGKAYDFAKEKGVNTMTVETLAPDAGDKNYLKTYNFYLTNGFAPLLNLKPQNYELGHGLHD